MSQPFAERKHNRSGFFKYLSPSTAKVVLSNRTLRWSAPVLFNDPFDVPRKLAVNVNPNQVKDALIERHLKLIEDPPEDLSDIEPKLRLIVETIRLQNSDSLRNEIIDTLRTEMGGEPIESFGLDDFRSHWDKIIKDMRILCLSERKDSTSMWHHYAEKYTGVVLEFKCDDELDSAWRIAEPITYIEDDPLVSTANGWAKLLTMPREQALKLLFNVCMYEKSEDWSYEREWRVASFKRSEDHGDFSDYSFNQAELIGIYLGPLISDIDKSEIVELGKRYCRARFYGSSIGPNRKLEFNQINS